MVLLVHPCLHVAILAPGRPTGHPGPARHGQDLVLFRSPPHPGTIEGEQGGPQGPRRRSVNQRGNDEMHPGRAGRVGGEMTGTGDAGSSGGAVGGPPPVEDRSPPGGDGTMKASEFRARTVRIHGHDVSYRMAGEGPTVLLVHGIAGITARQVVELPAIPCTSST